MSPSPLVRLLGNRAVTVAAMQEDLWILQQFPDDYMGLAADVGAWDGVQTSNTMLLEHMGWKVLCVEANPEVLGQLQFARSMVVSCACGAENQDEADFHIYTPGPPSHSALTPREHKDWPRDKDAEWKVVQVPVRTLDRLLEEAKFPRLDALSIDVEGGEPEVLEGCDLKRWNPKVIVLESWDDPSPLTNCLAERGYRLAERRGVNNLYIKEGV